jgi:preprotein translocase subunit SecG
MLYYLLVVLYVLVCLSLMVVILLQQGKGGDIANAFGGGGSQAVFGARAGATLLTKVTSGLAVGFMVVALVLAVWGQQGPGSVVGGVEGPAAPQLPAGALSGSTPAPTAPAATPAPAAETPAAAPAGGTTTPPADAPKPPQE